MSSGPNRSRPIRIANCSGFYGDRLSAAKEIVDGGPVDVLTGDWLAELTMAILAKDRQRRPDGGWARTFLTQIDDIMDAVVHRGVKVVSNAGGLNPRGCADAVKAAAAARGFKVRVAVVHGDNLAPRYHELRSAGETFAHVWSGLPYPDQRSDPETANAYLGGWGVAAALRGGADIVVTGRITDASLVVGPAAWWWDWGTGDWDCLAGAVAAGHVIECGTQATGGNFAFFQEVPGIDALGFPVAEVAKDGSSVITKDPDSGGMVTVETVTAQLLYEVDGPRYAGPDVTLRLDSLRLESVGPDRVRISGAAGEPPPDKLKVSMTSPGGWQNSTTFVLTGLDIQEKVDACLRALWQRLPGGPDYFDVVATDLIGGAGSVDGAADGVPLALLKVTVQDEDESKVGRPFSSAAVETGLASYPGLYFTGPPASAKAFQRYWPGTVLAEKVTQTVELDGNLFLAERPPVRYPALFRQPSTSVQAVDGPDHDGKYIEMPFGRLFGSRSGDKGGDFNVGVWARTPASYAWLTEDFDAHRFAAAMGLPENSVIDTYMLPNLLAVNFVVRDGLGEGVASTTHIDSQAKSAGEALRAARVHVPASLAPLIATQRSCH